MIENIECYPLIAVGIGPGDPDMITVKGLKALQQADVIFFPASSVSDQKVVSYSEKIIADYNLVAPCVPLHFPMTGKDRQSYYRAAYNKLKQAVDEGKKVVVVSEGDVLFYSTFGYLIEMAEADNLPFDIIAGIPAFIHAGSQMKKILTEGNQTLTVIALPESFEQIAMSLKHHDVVVVMKMKVLPNWPDFLDSIEGRFFYGEYLGTDRQFVTTNGSDLRERVIPYFSTIILHAN